MEVTKKHKVEGSCEEKLSVAGQGTVSFYDYSSDQTGHEIQIEFLPPVEDENSHRAGVKIGKDFVEMWCADGDGNLKSKRKRGEGIGLNLDTEQRQRYWLSLDSNNGRLCYGKGEVVSWLKYGELDWKNDGPFATKTLTRVRVEGFDKGAETELVLARNPFNLNPYPLVGDREKVTLESISLNNLTLITDLPGACQSLYGAVSGPNISLTPEDFPDFPAAIRRSIETPGCICYEKLAKKEQDFGYLRITIDKNLGDSPGQPYVLELWPSGRGSPIHDHGKACAIIKVLHGTIHVSLYSALTTDAVQKPFTQVDFVKDDVTFLTPDYYQVHKLHNNSDDFCATIQCYKYPAEDNRHYEYFDYLDENEEKIESFDPDSDWTYMRFKKKIKKEWHARGNKK